MARLALSLLISPNDRVQPIVDGSVVPDGIDLAVTTGPPADIFYRQLRFGEFDVSEMSLSTLLMLVARGQSPWVALPIFPIRRFFHTGIIVRRDAGISTPGDLVGKRVGVPEYQMTAALWARGALQHEFGVAPPGVQWYIERSPEHSLGGATGFAPPPDLRLEYVPLDQSFATLFSAGALDAVLFYSQRGAVLDRSGSGLQRHPAVRPLFPDPVAEGQRYYRATGLYPVNHVVVLRRTVLDRYPWTALNL